MEITSRPGRLSNSGRFGKSLPSLVEGRGNVSCNIDRLTQRMRLPDFVTLMKPRVMALAVFTALVGLMIAPGHLDPLLGSVAILAIAAGAGAAGILNMWYDADIDAVMTRTVGRPIPRARYRAPKRLHSTCSCLQRSRRSCSRAQR
jgi:heme O synthase-like polyprenyltransferase